MVVLAWMFWTLALWADSAFLSLACWILWAVIWLLCHAQSYTTTEEGRQALQHAWGYRLLTCWLKLEVSPVVLACWLWRCYQTTLRIERNRQ